MNNFLTSAMNRHLKGLLLLLLLFGSELVKNHEHGARRIFELSSGDSSTSASDSGEGCEGESESSPFSGSSGDDDGGFQSLQLEYVSAPVCPVFSRLLFAASSAAVESSRHRLLGRNSIPLFILHGTFRGALPA